jgi:hypothetical protein
MTTRGNTSIQNDLGLPQGRAERSVLAGAWGARIGIGANTSCRMNADEWNAEPFAVHITSCSRAVGALTLGGKSKSD